MIPRAEALRVVTTTRAYLVGMCIGALVAGATQWLWLLAIAFVIIFALVEGIIEKSVWFK